MSKYTTDGQFNSGRWIRDFKNKEIMTEGPGNDPMLKSLRTRVPGEKFPELSTWWEYEPDDIMTYVYWHQGQLPPTGPQFDKEWTNIVKQLHSKHPIPADVLPSVDLDKNAMDAIMHDVPRAENKLSEGRSSVFSLAKGLRPLLMIGSTIKSNAGENVLLKLSDRFEDLDDEDADSIASHLNMSIELMQDGSPSEARAWMKKFNKACADALSGKPVKSAFENVNEDIAEYSFQAGDKWSNDFDYVGMLTAGTEATYEMGLEHLTKLYDSFTDVNYHSEAADLGNALEWMEDMRGTEDEEKVKDFLESFRNTCAKTLKGITRR